MARPPRSLNAEALSSMPAGEQVIDKYGIRWVKNESGEWMSSLLTFSTSSKVAAARPTQPGWLTVDSKAV